MMNNEIQINTIPIKAGLESGFFCVFFFWIFEDQNSEFSKLIWTMTKYNLQIEFLETFFCLFFEEQGRCTSVELVWSYGGDDDDNNNTAAPLLALQPKSGSGPNMRKSKKTGRQSAFDLSGYNIVFSPCCARLQRAMWQKKPPKKAKKDKNFFAVSTPTHKQLRNFVSKKPCWLSSMGSHEGFNAALPISLIGDASRSQTQKCESVVALGEAAIFFLEEEISISWQTPLSLSCEQRLQCQ